MVPDVRDPSPPPRDLGGLYDAYSSAVYRLALKLCGNRSSAEDLVQDVFLRYWRQNRYDPKRGPVLAYLLLLTRSMAINRAQQQTNRWQLVQKWSNQLIGSPDPSPQYWAEVGEMSERVRHALDEIHPNQRQVIELAYYEGMSQSAIAERLQIPLGTVKTRSRQGLLALRRLLVDYAQTNVELFSSPTSEPHCHDRR